MTCETFFNETLSKEFDEYTKRNLQTLEKYARLPKLPDDVVGLMHIIKDLQHMQEDLSHARAGAFRSNLFHDLERKHKGLSQQCAKEKNEIKNKYEDLLKERVKSHDDAKKQARTHNESLDAEMRDAHEELLKYKESMRVIFERYNITPLDTAVTEKITESDFLDMLRLSLQLCAKYVRRDHDIIQKIMDFIGDDEVEPMYIFMGSFLSIIVIYITLPILSMLFFAKLFFAMHNYTNDVDGLRLASALMSDIDYKRFISEDSYMRVEDLYTKDLEQAERDELANVKDYTNECVGEAQAAQGALQRAEARASQFAEEFEHKRSANYQMIKKLIQEALQKKNTILSSATQFPLNQKINPVISYDYILSRIDGAVDVTANVGANNFTFDSSSREEMLQTIKLYLTNAILSVKPGNLFVEILDTATQCKDFAEFFSVEIEKFIKPAPLELQQSLDKYRKIVQDNIISSKGKTIDVVNMELSREERICKPYHLFIVLDPLADKFAKKDNNINTLESFLEYSAAMGVFVWIADTVKRPYTQFVKPIKKEGSAVPIDYQFSIGETVVSNFAKIQKQENEKIKILPYMGNYLDKVCPSDKIWSGTTVKSIELNFGYAEGDPSRPEVIKLGDDNVHALLAGATGSGKSATINQLMATLITKYPPSELELNFIDLKNAEAAKFVYAKAVKAGDKTIPDTITDAMAEHSRIPHFKILSGTTDGSYALSIITELTAEMIRRKKLCGKYGVVKIEDLRTKYPDVVVPRSLTIIDEFQQMFNREVVQSRIIDKITGQLGQLVKLSRAFGIHLLFLSQSMKGSLSADIFSNFRLRCALNCDASVSESILGNKASSLLPPKGYIYTNDSMGVDAKANKLWRIPFLDTEPLLLHIEALNNRLASAGEKSRNAVIYSESRLYSTNEIAVVYKDYPILLEKPNAFVLGAYTEYSESKIPFTIELMNNDSENILLTAFDKTDLMNLLSTLMLNLKIKNIKMIMNIQDSETFDQMEVEQFIDRDLTDICRPVQDLTEFIQAIIELVDSRVESGRKEFEPVYVVAVYWERSIALSDYNVDMALARIIKTGPTYNVHFIVAVSRKGYLSKSVFGSIPHIIAGKQMEAESMTYTGSDLSTRLPSRDDISSTGNFAIYTLGTTVSAKFKIYQREYRAVAASRVVTIQ